MKNLKSYVLIGAGALLLAIGIFFPNGDPVLGRIMNPASNWTSTSTFAGAIVADGGLEFDASNFTIYDLPIYFRLPDMTDDEYSKGSFIEWGGTMASSTYYYGSTTQTYKDTPGATFTIPVSKYNKWAWLGAHYASPASTGEPIHQHFAIETVKADWLTAITRFSISFGEDTALITFPTSNVKVYNDQYLQVGTDSEGLKISHDTGLSRIVASTTLPFQFASTTGLRIGSVGAPAGLLHLDRKTDAVGAKIGSSITGANTATLLLLESNAAGGTAIQSLVAGDTVNRFSMNTSGALQWGSGSATRDLGISRGAAGKLYVGNGTSGSKAATLVVDTVGVGTTSPATLLDVYNATATSSTYIYSGGAGLGGRLILEDTDGAGCTEVTALNGVLSAAIVACP